VNLMAKNMKDFDVSNEILSEHWLPVHVCMCASVVARACVRLSGKVPRVKVAVQVPSRSAMPTTTAFVPSKSCAGY
jgi:hypothetical protein